ncbi:MAG: putative DNA binding domain-containing protein [Desulfobacterales bacterium]|nr:putative DNA binding domain-containing protein [Desulfobacterales bacterium]
MGLNVLIDFYIIISIIFFNQSLYISNEESGFTIGGRNDRMKAKWTCRKKGVIRMWAFERVREIQYMITNGENSKVEFKEECAHNDSIAKEIIAFLNFKGGTMLFGVNDDRQVVGVRDENFEERIMNIFYHRIMPSVIPDYQEFIIDNKRVVVLTVEQGINKPYYTKVNGKNCYFLRYGSTSREATREELLRLFQASGNVHYEVSPVLNAAPRDLDFRNIEDYFSKYRAMNLNNFSQSEVETILINSEILSQSGENIHPTIAGMLLFAKNPKKYLHGSGIRAIHIDGKDIADSVIDHKFFERDVFHNIESVLDYLKLRINAAVKIGHTARREAKVDYPFNVLRELIVNAVVHRDYTIIGANIAVIVFEDRIEIKSPGAIPNSLTIEKIKQGIMYHRNPVLVQFLYDAGYVERLGRGVRNSIEMMRKYNGKEIDIASDESETAIKIYK